MRRFSLLVLGALALALAGCATMSPAERAAWCERVDWYDYGLNDGRLGVPPAKRAGIFAACDRLGRPADRAAYRRGHAEGLKEYCTVENGFRVGAMGARYRDVCPPELETGFLQGYEEGLKVWRRNYPPFRFGFGFGWHAGHWHHHWGVHAPPGWWW